LQGSGRGLIDVLFLHLPGGAEENHKNCQDSCVPVEILSGYKARATCRRPIRFYEVNVTFRLKAGTEEPEQTSIDRQGLDKHIPAATNMQATIEELPFLCNGEVGTPLQHYRNCWDNDGNDVFCVGPARSYYNEAS
jgi:hypothetical protein